MPKQQSTRDVRKAEAQRTVATHRFLTAEEIEKNKRGRWDYGRFSFFDSRRMSQRKRRLNRRRGGR